MQDEVNVSKGRGLRGYGVVYDYIEGVCYGKAEQGENNVR